MSSNEVGYADALGKTVICSPGTRMTFRSIRSTTHTLSYGNSIARLKDDLGKRISYHLTNPSRRVEARLPRLDFVIAGTLVSPGAWIEVPIEAQSRQQDEELVIGINNPEEAAADFSDLELSLILPEDFPPVYARRAI
jgi:hypothetical protein